MTAIVLVGIGGLVGSVLLYLTGTWVQSLTGNPSFPYGTLVVNVVGCLVVGLLNGLADARSVLTPELRWLLVVGFLGGFTTFSAFGYETFALARSGNLVVAALNSALQLSLGLFAVWAGYRLAQAAS